MCTSVFSWNICGSKTFLHFYTCIFYIWSQIFTHQYPPAVSGCIWTEIASPISLAHWYLLYIFFVLFWKLLFINNILRCCTANMESQYVYRRQKKTRDVPFGDETCSTSWVNCLTDGPSHLCEVTSAYAFFFRLQRAPRGHVTTVLITYLAPYSSNPPIGI